MTERKVEHVLSLIGVPANLVGFKYIKDAVMILQRDKENVKWTALYSEIGRKYGKSMQQVERGIRYALQTARSHTEKRDDIEHYIGFEGSNNSSSISLLYKIIRSETEDDGCETPVVTEKRVREIVRETIREMLGVKS